MKESGRRLHLLLIETVANGFGTFGKYLLHKRYLKRVLEDPECTDITTVTSQLYQNAAHKFKINFINIF